MPKLRLLNRFRGVSLRRADSRQATISTKSQIRPCRPDRVCFGRNSKARRIQFLPSHRKRSISNRRSKYRITAVHFGQVFRWAQNAGVTRIRWNRLQGWSSGSMGSERTLVHGRGGYFSFRWSELPTSVLDESQCSTAPGFKVGGLPRVSSRGSAVEEYMY